MRNLACFAALILALAVSSVRAAEPSDILLTVNGAPVHRSEVLARLTAQYGDAVVSQIVDELLVRQAAAAAKLKPDLAQVDARLKRIESQFPDEATFNKKLAANGGSIEALKAQLTEQVLREQLLMGARKISVSDAEARAFFDANKDRLGSPAAVHVRHILVGTEKEAADFLVALRAGADFARLASQVSLDNATKDRGGDMGWISPGMLQPQFEQLVFSLKPGQISDPLPTPAGFELVKVDEARAPKPAVYKDVQKDVKQALLADKLTKAWPAYIQELRKKAKIEQAR